MGCTKIGHCHQWPTSGTLTIQRCEIRCNFCDGDAGKKDWKYAWFLRRHVRAVHVNRGKYPDLQVNEGWDEATPKRTKKEARAASQKADIGIKDEEPTEFVQQPVYDEQRYGQQFLSTFDSGATVNDRTVNPSNAQGFAADVYEMSINDISFRNEHATVLEGHRANSRHEFLAWVDYLIGGDGMDNGDDFVSLMDSEPSETGIDPSLTQDLPEAMVLHDSAFDLTAGDNINVSPTREQRSHKRHDSDIAAAKFFMSDYDYPVHDAVEHMPLAQVFNDHLYSQHPDLGEFWPVFSENVNKTTEQMREQGVDIESMQHMLAALILFARTLKEAK